MVIYVPKDRFVMLFKITGSFGKHFHTVKVSYTMSYRLLHKFCCKDIGDKHRAPKSFLNHGLPGHKPSSTTKNFLVVKVNVFFPKELQALTSAIVR